MKQIIYVSTAVQLMSQADLIEILETSREQNRKHDITGVLLYASGTFIQLLEGAAADVNLIYEVIERDARHKNVIKLVDKPALDRSFPDWSMGFSLVYTAKAKELMGFLKSTDEILNHDKKDAVIGMLKTFITTANLNINY